MAHRSLSKVVVCVGMLGLAGIARADVRIEAGEDIQAIVWMHPPGTVYRIGAGLHRGQTIAPQEGDTFIGEPAAVLSGAIELADWTETVCGDAPCWVIDGQTQEGAGGGECADGYPRCARPDDVWIDGWRQRARDGFPIAAGEVYFDYDADRIYLGSSPWGRTVEASVTPFAFDAAWCASGVTIRDLTVMHYANPAQTGAINCPSGADWTLASVHAYDNHGGGIETGPRRVFLNVQSLGNGQIGIRGSGDDVRVDGGEIAWNNDAGYAAGWEGGGTKFWQTHRLRVTGVFVHHNFGPGLWADTDNIDLLFDGNTVEDNDRMGIFHEIGYRAQILHNVVRRNGYGYDAWGWGAGIVVAGSADTEVGDNLVEDNADGIIAIQQERGSGADGPYLVVNLWVHDNDVQMGSGWTGLLEDVGDWACFTERGNRFERNRYRLTDRTGEQFTWNDQELRYDAFNAMQGFAEFGVH